MMGASMEREPAWVVRLCAELDDADRRARALMAGMTEEQLNWRATPRTWSVGQCIDHLCVANEAYLPAMRAALQDTRNVPVEEITPGALSSWFIQNYIEPSTRTKSARAPGKIVPSKTVDLTVLDRFLKSNRTAREVIAMARFCDVNRIRFRNPLVPLVRFTVGAGFEILSGHERRHLLQAEKVKSSPEFGRVAAS